MVDRSFLDEASLEFAVVADTHYLPDPGDRPLEFESRRRQAGRAEYALRLAAALRAAFVVHLGDLAQAVPEGDGFARALDEALAQVDRCGVRPYHVAGNQDIGDKPDPTMPTAWVTPATLAAYHARLGRSWYGWSAADRRCLVLNSQIMNTTLPEAEAQWRWLAEEVAAHADRRLLLFLHLPLYLCDEHDPDLGHYDTLGQPARARLLDLIRRHRVELVLSGHAHWSFVDRVGTAQVVVCPSTSHTRPGFSELFASAPPPEQGRDDTPKLGITLVRLKPDGPRLHRLLTNGASGPLDPADGALLLTRLARDLPRSPLGVTLTHPLAPVAAVPLAWPSVVRQPVRNDYPLLACREMGVRHARVPAADLADPLQRRRLALLRDEGVALTGLWLWRDGLDLAAAAGRHADLLDGVEVQVPGRRWPDATLLAACQALRPLPVTLAPVLTGQPVPGKQLLRTRIGYHLDEIGALDAHLAATGGHIDRVLCRLPAEASLWEMADAGLPDPARIDAIDWVLDPATTDERRHLARVAAALFAVARLPGARLSLEPLIDLDRTMDIGLGLLDRRCNPRPAYHALRALTTVLHADDGPARPLPAPTVAGLTLHGLARARLTAWLVLPTADGEAPRLDARRLAGGDRAAPATVIDLTAARSRSVAGGDQPLTVDRPLLVVFR
jgi:hypothetical protein